MQSIRKAPAPLPLQFASTAMLVTSMTLWERRNHRREEKNQGDASREGVRHGVVSAEVGVSNASLIAVISNQEDPLTFHSIRLHIF